MSKIWSAAVLTSVVLLATTTAGGAEPAGVEAVTPFAGAGPDTLVSSDGSVISLPEEGLPADAGLAFEGDPSGAEVSPEAAPPLDPGATSPSPASHPPTENVIGVDGRTQVTPTTTYPSQAIGQVTFQQYNGATTGSYICSGFLIDPNTVATSGHCVNHGGEGTDPAYWSTNVFFTPGRDGAVAPYGSCGATSLVTTDGWLETYDAEYDFGFVQLDCQIGSTVGWFGVRSPLDADLLNSPLTVRGYPGDKPAGTMWTMDDLARALRPNLAFYQADTAGGQSGSPVYSVDAADCAGPCALAVHSYGAWAAAGPPFSENNYGPRIHDGRRAQFLAVAAANSSGCTNHPFGDVPAWVGPAVDWVFCNEYMTGYPGNVFRPDNDITRAEVARLLYRVNNSPEVADLDPHGFSDVPAWVEDAVRWLAHYDYATGYQDQTFRPGLPISRAEVTRMIYRIAGSPTGSPPNPFSDVPSWVDAAVDWMVDPVHTPRYATGYPGNVYKPNDDIPRAQTARMTCRVFALVDC